MPVFSPPPALAIAQLEHEYQAARELDPVFAVRPLQLKREGGIIALILEDFACHALASDLTAPLELDLFFRIAAGVTGALAALHRQGVVHKDIKPEHIFLAGGSDGSVGAKLTGFGFATTLSRERQALDPPESIAGTLAYMAPEQTGRMNRSVDSRSDLYSLGVTFYQMLAGRLPFSASDPMEWVHCHIAIQPPPLSQYRGDIPRPLSDIVMKLQAKNAEDRYQTAEGLKADLERCAAGWHAGGRITPFPLGEHDIPDRFLIPEKLYGREGEVELLLSALARVAAGGKRELVLVSGYSGVGKSALVNELHKALVPAGGLFASGKFDQYKRGIPYATLGQALARLIHSLLGKSEAELEGWRQSLKEALGPNGRLIADLVPDLRLIAGEQPALPRLEPQQAKARFQLVFRRFLSAFASPEHPLVLFLDDLQWLDGATLDLIEDLLTHEDVRHLLLIGAYRDNEVGPTHPLMRKLEAIGKADTAVQDIKLAPLSLDDLTQLIADSLHCEHEYADPLARLVYAKTGGNPFFAVQFLTALAQEGLLVFDHGEGRWSWDLQSVHAKGYTDNVADLMAAKLTRLPVRTQRAVQQLACLGYSAQTPMLSLILGMPEEEVQEDLKEAVRQEFIQRLDGSFRFVHDRVQEATYLLIPESSRAETHLKIGRLLLAHTPEEMREEAIFEIVSQLNRGTALITQQEERNQLAGFNLIAGKRAKGSTAYASALTYFVTGAQILRDGCWEREHELIFALELNRAECEYLTGDLAAAGQRLDMLAAAAANTVERGAVAVLRINLYMTLNQSDRAIEVGLEYLRHAGIHWSSRPAAEEVEQEFQRLWQRLENRSIEEIAGLPLISDAGARATMDVLTTLMPPALFTDRNLQCLLIARMANFSLEHGNSGGSCFAYVWLGMLLGPQFGDYQAGFRFGQLSVDLVEKRGLLGFKARVYLGFAHVIPWTRHVRMGVPSVRTAFETARETGDLSFAAISYGALITHLLACGDPLAEVQRQAEAALGFARKTRFGLVADMVGGQLGLIRTLRGLTPQFGCFTEAGFEESLVEEHLGGNPRLAYSGWRYWIRKLQARCLAGDYVSAIAAAEQAEQFLSSSFLAYFEIAEYHFYAALARAAHHDEVPAGERPAQLEALIAHHRQLELWAHNCPETFENRWALAAAEIARIEGRPLDAMHLYEKAIVSARASGFVHNEAVAHEVAGRFYLACGFETAGLAYLRQSRACYALWGANGKVKQFDRLYPQMAAQQAPLAAASTAPPVPQLDTATVAKASQAVSGSIELPKLIETLMTIALENAGADRGLLILPRGTGFEVEVEAKATSTGAEVALAPSAVAETRFSEAIVHYVVRTQKSVIVDDASRPGEFFEDVYLHEGPARSVFCLPLLRQGKLAGLLYLENSRAAGAFTPDRIAVLDVLAAQAAISLENARLYSELRESEANYSRIVNTAAEGIWVLDPEGNTVFVNTKMAEMLGCPAGEMVGRPVSDFMFEEDASEHPRRMEKRRQGISEHFERRFRHKDGHTVWTMVSAAPILDDQHQFRGAFGMHTDITERKHAEEELGRYRNELEETVYRRTVELLLSRDAAEAANKAKSAFLASMSHELRTPLNAILGFSSLLQGEADLSETQRGKLGIINRSGEHLLSLINNVLEIAKIEAGRAQLQIAPFDVCAMVRDVAAMMQIRAQEKGLRLLVDQSPAVPRYVKGDEARLRQVLVNLVGNAVKFTKQGGIAIRLGVKENGRLYAVLEVEDTGPGIGAEDQKRLFEPFVQVGEAGAQKGTGLGLAISRQFVELMGGTIGVKSTPGNGSVFRVEVPVEAVTEAGIVALEETAPAREVTGLAPGQPAYRILIAEDQRENQMLLDLLMTRIGLEAKVAENGEECVKLFRDWHPHLIWMDRRMPVMDGIMAARTIRGLPDGKDVKIVAVTASAFKEQQQEMLDAGMDDFVRKPYRPHEIYDSLARQLGVQYVYETAVATLEAKPAPVAQIAGRLAALPDEVRKELADALESLDGERIMALILQIGHSDAELGGSLHGLAENFDYPAILSALAPARQQPDSQAVTDVKTAS